MWLQGRGHFWPQGHNLNNLVEVHKVMLHTKYQGPRPYGFRQENFSTYFHIDAYFNMWPLGQGHFWLEGNNLNKLGKVLGLKVSDKKIFFIFSLNKPMLNMWPPGRSHIGPRGIIWTNLVEVHKVMLHTKYQGPRPYVFRQENFYVLPYWRLFKHVTPGAGPYWSKGG